MVSWVMASPCSASKIKGQVNKSQIKVEDGDFDFELKDRDYKIVEEKQTNVYKPRQKQVYIPVAK